MLLSKAVLHEVMTCFNTSQPYFMPVILGNLSLLEITKWQGEGMPDSLQETEEGDGGGGDMSVHVKAIVILILKNLLFGQKLI